MRWRIGYGSSVKIYQDRWPPESSHGKVISPIVDITLDATVDILIDQELCCWRNMEIDRLFLPFEAIIIKAIPLSFARGVDDVFWPRNRDWVYFIKSGYKLLLEDEGKDMPCVSNPDMMKGVWKGIWKLKVPQRIRALIWRAGSESFPTKVNLVKRKLLTDILCPQC